MESSQPNRVLGKVHANMVLFPSWPQANNDNPRRVLLRYHMTGRAGEVAHQHHD